jgi:hypothetical protein
MKLPDCFLAECRMCTILPVGVPDLIGTYIGLAKRSDIDLGYE